MNNIIQKPPTRLARRISSACTVPRPWHHESSDHGFGRSSVERRSAVAITTSKANAQLHGSRRRAGRPRPGPTFGFLRGNKTCGQSQRGAAAPRTGRHVVRRSPATHQARRPRMAARAADRDPRSQARRGTRARRTLLLTFPTATCNERPISMDGQPAAWRRGGFSQDGSTKMMVSDRECVCSAAHAPLLSSGPKKASTSQKAAGRTAPLNCLPGRCRHWWRSALDGGCYSLPKA